MQSQKNDSNCNNRNCTINAIAKERQGINSVSNYRSDDGEERDMSNGLLFCLTAEKDRLRKTEWGRRGQDEMLRLSQQM